MHQHVAHTFTAPQPTPNPPQRHRKHPNRQVRSALAEAHMPDFELGHKVGRKIGYQRYRRAVLVCVVDVTDFDGSLPRMALQQVLETCTAIANKAKQQGDEQGVGGGRGGVYSTMHTVHTECMYNNVCIQAYTLVFDHNAQRWVFPLVSVLYWL